MDDLKELVAAELATLVDPRVAKLAAAIAGKYGAASRAVLFYGCKNPSDAQTQLKSPWIQDYWR